MTCRPPSVRQFYRYTRARVAAPIRDCGRDDHATPDHGIAGRGADRTTALYVHLPFEEMRRTPRATPGRSPAGVAFQRQWESDALIRFRGVGLNTAKSTPVSDSGADLDPMPLSGYGHSDVMRRKTRCDRRAFTAPYNRGLMGEGIHLSSPTSFEGFMTHRSQHSGPKEMRIPPLRSAVQMGSDVSPGSSVTPDRSSGLVAELRTMQCVHNFVYPPNPEHSLRTIPVDPAGGHCYWSPI